MRILLINGAQVFTHSNGELNNTLHKTAVKQLTALGHEIKETVIAQGYNEAEEVQKILWAETIIYQMPGWWMGPPWSFKKYIDEVFTQGYGHFYANDGRTRSDPTKQYGTGGLLQGRRYMLSVTWNAPEEAFNELDNFFEGQGVDGVYFPFHKSQQFVGLSALPSFLAADVMKTPRVDKEIAAYQTHLQTLFSQ